MNSIMEATRINLGFELLALGEYQEEDEAISLQEDGEIDALGEPVFRNEVSVNPSITPDYLQAMIDQEEAEKNAVVLGAAEHQAIAEINSNRPYTVVRRKVANRRWQPGQPLDVEIGQVTVLGISGPSKKQSLPARPKSFIGQKIRREIEKAKK